MKEIIKTLHTLSKLKEIKRTGWMQNEVPNPESIADHSFRTAITVLFLADKFDIDKDKAVQMALIHDIGESIIGDYTPNDDITPEKKHQKEKSAMIKLLSHINKNLISLWEEYAKKETKEARFVSDIDKIEMLMQAFEYESKNKEQNLTLDEFWEYTDERVKDPELRKIIESLKKERINM